MRKLYLVTNGSVDEVMESLSKTPLSYRSVHTDSGTLIVIYDSFRSEAFCRRYLEPLGASELYITALPMKSVKKTYTVKHETNGVLTNQLRPKFEHGVSIYVERNSSPPQLIIEGDENDIAFFLKDNSDYLEVSEKEVT